MIEKMKGSVRNGVKSSVEVSNVFSEITQSSKDTLGFSRDILESTQQQTKVVSEVIGNTENILVIAEESAAASEQVASSASELATGMKQFLNHTNNFNQVSKKLNDGINKFSLSNSTNFYQDEELKYLKDEKSELKHSESKRGKSKV
jgi:methyl-accepting chemotaxis protein